MPQGGHDRLGFQHFTAPGAVGAFGQAVLGTGGCHSRVYGGVMTQGRQFLRLRQCQTATGAGAQGGFPALGTGGFHCVLPVRFMTQGRQGFCLLYPAGRADPAPASFLGAGGSLHLPPFAEGVEAGIGLVRLIPFCVRAIHICICSCSRNRIRSRLCNRLLSRVGSVNICRIRRFYIAGYSQRGQSGKAKAQTQHSFQTGMFHRNTPP